MTTSISSGWPAPAKLNLFLHITGRRADGYHLLQTLFQFLDYGDSWISSCATTAGSCVRAGSGGCDRSGRSCGARGAPAAGAHRDAARVWRSICINACPAGGSGRRQLRCGHHPGGLNQLWGTGSTGQDLAALGLELGADVPVFHGGEGGLGGGHRRDADPGGAAGTLVSGGGARLPGRHPGDIPGP